MKRVVEPEWLDQLAAEDPLAARSRRDLRRINACMGNARILARQMQQTNPDPKASRVLDLGAGDGSFFGAVATHMPQSWKGTRLDLVDRQATLSPAAAHYLQRRGWHVRTIRAEIPQWFLLAPGQCWTVVCANLFLHHFREDDLRHLLQTVSQHTSAFIALEPRRSVWALVASRLVGFIGCSQLTRHDATLSVRAGFTETALSKLWPTDENWTLQERSAGLFGHLFVARRNGFSSTGPSVS